MSSKRKKILVVVIIVCVVVLFYHAVDVVHTRTYPYFVPSPSVEEIFRKFYRDKDPIKDFDEVLSHELGLWIGYRKGLRQLEDPIGKSRQIAALLEYALLKKKKIKLEKSIPLMQRLKNERIGHIGWWCRQVLKAYGLQEGSGSEGSGE